MKVWVLAALATAAFSGVASAADEKVHPQTARQVTPAERAAVYPKAAFEKKISGEALLDCTADEEGREVDCKVIGEDPAGMGFGEAALALVTKERVKTKDAQGVSIVGKRFESGFGFLAPGDSNPDWVRKPTAEALATAFPTKALKTARAGKAVIQCQVTIEGFLDRCKVLTESPVDFGFGAAALQLAPQFKLSPKIRGGKPVAGGEVTIPINWDMSGLSPDTGASFGGRSLIIDPPWSVVPSFEQVRAAWPQEAKGLASGQAALRCSIAVEGTLKSCDVISEAPSGKGFGKAAKALSRDFKINVKPDETKLLRNLSVDVPFRFRDPALPDTRKLTSPRWTVTLTTDGMAAIYPQAAVKANATTGLGVVSCAVDAGGRLVDCMVKREEPAALDFGAAALEAAKLMAMNPWTTEGDTVEGLRITLPIRFLMPESAQAATPPAPPAKP
ncbi:TonB family protein [Caulobacter soli]|uniref:TonB family protein n=1 Tax=Caulobacter soli TaxID=2708539 RepID=UPI0013EC3307|nr:TonB family protein [Caulobacter soli]